MGSVATWLSEARQSRTADLVVDTTLRQLKERSRVLDKYSQMKTKEGRDWLAYITTQIDPIASLVAPGADVPSVRKAGFSRVQAKLFKAAIRHEWDEELQWKLKEVKEFAQARGITVQNITTSEGKVSVGQDNNLAEMIFGTLTGLVRGHANLLDFLNWQVLQTGAMTYTDSRTGLRIDLDWKPAIKSQYNHFPAALTGNRRWTEHETADPIQDLVDALYIYKMDNGVGPDEICMSEQLMHQVLRCKSVRESVVSSLTIGSAMTGTVSVEQLNEVLRRRFLPAITLEDSYVQMDPDNNGSDAFTRFLDPTRIVFLKKGATERVLGGTLENQGKAGIYQRTFEKSKEPVLDISTTASMMCVVAPTISKTGFSRQVTDANALAVAQNLADFNF